MNFWRMQLHPSESAKAVEYTMRCLGLGYIGLDFAAPPGDLTDVSRDSIPNSQRDYWEFSHTMAERDVVLIVSHHYPCALVRVSGAYNYIREPREELNVWFRHFRRVKVIGYYADLVTDPTKWEKTTMTDTISPLLDNQGKSYSLIKRWLSELEA